MSKVKPLKIRQFVQNMIDQATRQGQEELDISPVKVQELYEAAYPNLPKKDSSTYRITLKRMGLDKEKRKAVSKELLNNQAQLDIEDYSEVRAYRLGAARDGVQADQIERQVERLRKLWTICGKTNVREWQEEFILESINKAFPMKLNPETGKLEYEHPANIKTLLGSFNTMFQGKLRKNWSANLCKHKAGELKDFFSFYELDAFFKAIQGNEKMSFEGWMAMFAAHVNLGCREGVNGKTGICGLLWQDINFNSKRCTLREKGHRGNAGERWNDCPLDMFPFLKGWHYLLKHWENSGRPKEGNVFPVNYDDYQRMFHETRKKAAVAFDVPRIGSNSETMRLHIFRRTHGQYARRLGIPLEFICGDAPFGRFGVGWKDPKIPVKYYLTQESEYIDSRELQFMANNPEYRGFMKAMQEQAEKQKQWLGLA